VARLPPVGGVLLRGTPLVFSVPQSNILPFNHYMVKIYLEEPVDDLPVIRCQVPSEQWFKGSAEANSSCQTGSMRVDSRARTSQPLGEEGVFGGDVVVIDRQG